MKHELERALEQDGQMCAQQMKGLLETINRKVTEAGGALDDKGAQIFCRVRGYLSTCRKHGVSSSHALGCLFDGKLADVLLQE